MKIIEAGLKLYDHKNDHTNGNTDSQAGDVDDRVTPVTRQTSESCFEIIFKHRG